MSEATKKIKSKKFNAVDLITVVVFSAMFRVLWVVFKMAGVVFPFNHSFMMLFSSFSLIICMAVVKKRWTSFYYTVAWVAINFFLQGEIPHYFACIVILPIIPELYAKARSTAFENPDDVYHSFKDMTIFSYIYNIIYFIWNFIMIRYVFLIPISLSLVIVAFAIGLVFIGLGVFLGLKTGIKVNSLIN